MTYPNVNSLLTDIELLDSYLEKGLVDFSHLNNINLSDWTFFIIRIHVKPFEGLF